MKPTFLSVRTHQAYAVDSMDPSSLCCLQNGCIKLTLFHYGPIKLILLMEWTHQHYIVYSIVPTNVCSLRNRPIKLKLLRAWTHHMYIAYSID